MSENLTVSPLGTARLDREPNLVERNAGCFQAPRVNCLLLLGYCSRVRFFYILLEEKLAGASPFPGVSNKYLL